MIETCQTAMVAALPWGMDLWDVGLSVGIQAAVTMLVLAVFGQSGAVKLSPEREAALATGHSDRKTVFERPVRPHGDLHPLFARFGVTISVANR